MARILNISDLELFPVRNGTQRTTFELCMFLAKKGHSISVVNLHNNNVNNKIRNIHWINAVYNLQLPKSKLPFGFIYRFLNYVYLRFFKITVKQPFILTKLELRKIDDIIDREKIDTLLIHRAHLGRYVKYLNKTGVKLKILQAHDLQYMRDDRFQNFKGKDISKKLEKHIRSEINILNYFDKVIDLADYEVKDLVSRGISTNLLYSNGIPVEYMDYSKYNDQGKYDLLFVGGNLFQNKVSLDWFIQNVWENIDQTRYKFAIAGRICVLLKDKKYNNLILLGEFDTARDIYSNSKIVIAPLVVGSGVKVKVVEALMNSKVVITNNLGIEGINVRKQRDYIHCEESEEWITNIENIIADNKLLKRIGYNAWAWASKNATAESVYGELEKTIRIKTMCVDNKI